MLMIKKLLVLVAMMMPFVAVADGWKLHPRFVAANTQGVVDAGNKVYYLAAGSVYCHDKTTGTDIAINSSNKLSDITVTGMFYNDVKGYLVLTYDNSNIDIITRDNRVVNIPEIKDAVVQQKKAIINVTFDSENNKAFVCADFGFAVINDNTFAIEENHYYGMPMTGVLRMGNQYVVGIDNGVKFCSVDALRENYIAFRPSGIYLADITLHPIDETHFFINSRSSFDLCTINSDYTFTRETITPNRAAQVQRTPTGYVASFPAINTYITTDQHGAGATLHTSNGEFVSSNPDGDGTIWSLDGNGLHRKGEASAAPEVSIGIKTTAFWTAYNPMDGKLYLSSTTDNALLTSANKGAVTEIWTYDGTRWENSTPAGVPLYNNGQDTYQGNYELIFVPGKNEYLFSTRAAGIAHVKDGKVAASYYTSNMPRDDKYRAMIALDSHNNLFAVQSYKTNTHQVMVLPQDKLANPAAVTTGDWYTPTVPNIEAGAFKCASLVVSKGTDIKVFASGSYQRPVVIWDDGGNIANTKPRSTTFVQFKSDDNRVVNWDYVYCLYAASDGCVWLGNDNGVIRFDPAHAFDNDFRVTRVPVESQVNCVNEDEDGNIWVGTNTSGVYQLSLDGKKVLRHFDTENGVMPSNCIYSVQYYPPTKSVMIVTSNGVTEYFTDEALMANRTSSVTVSPNPVRPDFTGYATITGLDENAQVTITAQDGTVVKEMTATGSKALWDCNDANGSRVATGTYNVLCNGKQATTLFIIK